MGFGHSSHIRTIKILRLSQDPPIVIEVIDAEERTRSLGSCINRSPGRTRAEGWVRRRLTAAECRRSSGRLSHRRLQLRLRKLLAPRGELAAVKIVRCSGPFVDDYCPAIGPNW